MYGRRKLEVVYAASTIAQVVETACRSIVVHHVVGLEVFVSEGFAGILLDAFHDGHAADGAVVGDVVVHAAVLFRSEHSAAVHVSAFEDVDKVAILLIEDKLTPGYFVHLAGER